MPYLTADETAERYRITTKGLLKQRSEGRLPGALGKRVGKRVLWPSEELDIFDEEGTPETETFGALHALVLETRGVNNRLQELIRIQLETLAELVNQRPEYIELTVEETEDE